PFEHVVQGESLRRFVLDDKHFLLGRHIRSDPMLAKDWPASFHYSFLCHGFREEGHPSDRTPGKRENPRVNPANRSANWRGHLACSSCCLHPAISLWASRSNAPAAPLSAYGKSVPIPDAAAQLCAHSPHTHLVG